jgi:hypothetical protein
MVRLKIPYKCTYLGPAEYLPGPADRSPRASAAAWAAQTRSFRARLVSDPENGGNVSISSLEEPTPFNLKRGCLYTKPNTGGAINKRAGR